MLRQITSLVLFLVFWSISEAQSDSLTNACSNYFLKCSCVDTVKVLNQVKAIKISKKDLNREIRIAKLFSNIIDSVDKQTSLQDIEYGLKSVGINCRNIDRGKNFITLSTDLSYYALYIYSASKNVLITPHSIGKSVIYCKNSINEYPRAINYWVYLYHIFPLFNIPNSITLTSSDISWDL